MKSFLLSLILFLFATSSFAQSFKFSVDAGLNESTFSESFTKAGDGILVHGQTISKSFVTGYHIDGLVDLPIRRVSIQTGIIYTTIGGINNDHYNIPNSYEYSDKQKLNLNYIQVPLNILYHIPVKFGNVFLGGGPYIGYGLFGKYQDKGSDINSASTSSDVVFGNGQNGKYNIGNGQYVKNPDYGINTAAGVSLTNKIKLSASYKFGIANLSRSMFTNGRNNVLSISIGYNFN